MRMFLMCLGISLVVVGMNIPEKPVASRVALCEYTPTSAKDAEAETPYEPREVPCP